MPTLAKFKDCTGCMVCVDSCHQQALQCSMNDEGHIVPVVDESKCINCGLCLGICPLNTKRDLNNPKVYGLKSKSDSIRSESSSIESKQNPCLDNPESIFI